MKSTFKLSVLAAAVSVVVTGAAASQTPMAQHHLAQSDLTLLASNYDHNAMLARAGQSDVVKKSIHSHSVNYAGAAKANKAALNQSHFDKDLNTTTFRWATGNEKALPGAQGVLSRQAALSQATANHVRQVAKDHGVTAKAFAQAKLRYVSDNNNGSVISKYQQQVDGIDVWGRELNLLMDKNLRLVASSGYFSSAKPLPLAKPGQSAKSAQFALPVSTALTTAFNDFTGQSVQLSQLDQGQSVQGQYQLFTGQSDAYDFSAPLRGKSVYYPTKKKLIPAYYVEFMASEKGQSELIAYSYIVSAVDGSILNKTNLVQHDAFSYKVFADNQAPFTPFDSPSGSDLTPHPTGVFDDPITEPTVVMNDVTIEHAGIHTNDPWLAPEATTTIGNNVDAYADLTEPDGFNEGDLRPETTSRNTFDYPYDVNGKFDDKANIQSAVVNLFYTNNYLHDVYYNHGFDEAAGVAQTDNYGRGGIEGDPLHAEAQDYGSVNNANMATPADGASPRMQMFIWQDRSTRDGSVDNAIVAHEWGHYFSSRLTNGGLYANNQGGSMGEGWGDFVALMMMVRESDQLLPGNDQWQGIYNDGGYAVNNGYVTNAYFFGLRRAPYTTNMDFNGFTFKHIQDQVRVPSHEMSNLYQDDFWKDGVLNAEVHNSGEIWAMALWESYTALLNRDGLSFTEAQNRMRDYMVASLKITPFAPTFTEARDALLAVAIANDEADYLVIKAAFAKRGMGVLAVSPDRNDPGFDGTLQSQGHTGVVESFEVTSAAVAAIGGSVDNQYISVNGAYCDVDGILDVGETALISVNISNAGTEALSQITAQVSTKADVTFANNGVISFTDMAKWRDTSSGSLEVTLNAGEVGQVIEFIVNFSSDDSSVVLPEPLVIAMNSNFDLAATRDNEDFEDHSTVWLDWQRSQLIDNGGSDAGHFIAQWEAYKDSDFGNVGFGPDLSSTNDISLITPALVVADSGEFAMNFEHYYDFELSDNIAWDGGVMEISIDGGDWLDVIAAGGTFATGYNGQIGEFNPFLANRDGFVGLIPSSWISAETLTFADGLLNGKTVKIRFRIGSDEAVAAWGWNIDNVNFTNITNTPFSSVVADSASCANRTPLLTEVTGPQVMVAAGEPVTLTASAIDFDDSALTYQWRQTAGSVSIDTSSTSASLTFTAPVATSDEQYSFSVVVSDGEFTSAAKTISFDVKGNSAPVLTAAVTEFTVKEQQSVTLNVDGSDADNNSLTYHWTIPGQFNTTTEGSLDFVAPSVSADTTLSVSVVADDGSLTSEPVILTVNVVANQAPSLSVEQSSITMRADESVDLSVNASDPEGDDLVYRWEVNGTVLANTGPSYTFVPPPLTEDTVFLFTVTAFDGDELSNPVFVEVGVITNKAPQLSTDDEQLSVKEQQAIVLSVNGSDPDSDTLSYQWQVDGVAIDNNAPFINYTAPAVTEDKQVVFDVVASDGELVSETVQLVLNVVANQAPVISPTVAHIRANEGDFVVASVTATDPEGDSLTYHWTQDGVVIDNTSASYRFELPAVSDTEQVVFSVTASDGDEVTAPVEITVTVNNRDSGGGSTGLVSLLLLPLVYLRRRLSKKSVKS